MSKIIARVLNRDEVLAMHSRGSTDQEITRYFKLLGMVVVEDGAERELVTSDIKSILQNHSFGVIDAKSTEKDN
jgi:hypothetical protein